MSIFASYISNCKANGAEQPKFADVLGTVPQHIVWVTARKDKPGCWICHHYTNFCKSHSLHYVNGKIAHLKQLANITTRVLLVVHIAYVDMQHN